MSTMYGTDRPSTLINDTRWLLHFGSWSRVRSAMNEFSSPLTHAHERLVLWRFIFIIIIKIHLIYFSYISIPSLFVFHNSEIITEILPCSWRYMPVMNWTYIWSAQNQRSQIHDVKNVNNVKIKMNYWIECVILSELTNRRVNFPSSTGGRSVDTRAGGGERKVFDVFCVVWRHPHHSRIARRS